MKKAPKEYQDRCKEFSKLDTGNLEKLSLERHIVAIFPRHKKVPLLSKIALSIIRRQGGSYCPQLRDVIKK